jgi:hypothetical protein
MMKDKLIYDNSEFYQILILTMAWLFAVSYLGSLINGIESMGDIHIAIQMKFDKDFLVYIRTKYPLMPSV